MDRERLDNYCEKGILGLVLAILVFGPLANGAVSTPEFLVVLGAGLGVLALWLVRAWVRGHYRLLWPPACWGVLAFVAYAIWRYTQADIEYVARQELIRILLYAGLFLAIVNNLHRQESTQIVVTVLVFLGLMLACYAIYQFVTGTDKVWHLLDGLHLKPKPYLKRASGTFIYPNALACLLGMIVPLALAFVFTGRSGHASKVIWAYAALVMLAGIGVTISRAGWVAAGLALLCFFIVLIRNRHYRIFAVAALLLLAVGGWTFTRKAEASRERFKRLLNPGDVEGSRLALWRPTIGLWRQSPWLGVGPAHFDHRFPSVRPQLIQARPLRAHNDYLNTLADWGVVGFGLAAAVWGLVFAGALKTWKYSQRDQNDLTVKQSNRTALVLGAVTGLLALLLHSFADFNLHIPANAITAVTLLALLTGHMRFASDRYWWSGGWLARLAVSVVCLAGLVYLGRQEILRAGEHHWLARAAAAQDNFATRLNALKQAHAVEPKNFETTYKIGETLRVQGWAGGEGAKELVEEAATWFQRGLELNRHDAYQPLRLGMCLDWLGRTADADPHFKRAGELDPNGYYVVAHLGWHEIQRGDWQRAKTYFERSLEITYKPYLPNPMAKSYLDIVKRRLAEEGAAK
jgi:O-antigen ligase